MKVADCQLEHYTGTTFCCGYSPHMSSCGT